MHPVLSITLAAIAASSSSSSSTPFAGSFVLPSPIVPNVPAPLVVVPPPHRRVAHYHHRRPPPVYDDDRAPTASTTTTTTELRSSTNAPPPPTGETEAERLLRRARELRDEARSGEDELHSTLIDRKRTRDAATDAIIERLFPRNDDDVDDDAANDVDDVSSLRELCDRLRERRLAADVLVNIVERLHERGVAARGLERVEPSVHHDKVAFARVGGRGGGEVDEVEIGWVRHAMDMLIRAAMVLDAEFIEEKESKRGGRITHSDITHWGGGNIAGMLRDKVNDLGRAHDEQFQKRLESFYDAAKRKHSRDEFVDKDSWRDGDVWSP
ncbi:hypothetical protein ACHAXA_003017 [Cyclostephanos tholiformis]|uniref:Uncharacterized protein n=1 Tax=Cyclostephanos tholiformis TaxID=382380 RepID=A0ABD3R8J3_9STRA